MPQQAWSRKRERQYDAIKDSLEDRGRDEDTAAEIAARPENTGKRVVAIVCDTGERYLSTVLFEGLTA